MAAAFSLMRSCQRHVTMLYALYLCREPKERPHATRLLQHPWLADARPRTLATPLTNISVDNGPLGFRAPRLVIPASASPSRVGHRTCLPVYFLGSPTVAQHFWDPGVMGPVVTPADLGLKGSLQPPLTLQVAVSSCFCHSFF
jgi:hypothetical protein